MVFVSHLPAIVGARVRLIFPKVQNHAGLEFFFRDLSLSLFETSSLHGKLIGHIKLYGKGDSKSMIRANATGSRESVQVEIRNPHPETGVELWLNIIAYKMSEDELRRNFLRTLIQTAKRHGVKVRGLEIEDEHGQH